MCGHFGCKGLGNVSGLRAWAPTFFAKDCKTLPKSETKFAKSGAPEGPGGIGWASTSRPPSGILFENGRGGLLDFGRLRVAFGALGCPKASAIFSHQTFRGAILDQKSEKRHPKRHPTMDAEATSKDTTKRLSK